MYIQGWFPLEMTGWLSCCPRDSQESYLAPQFESSNSWHSAFFMVQLLNPYTITGKNIPDYKNLCLQSDVSAF